MCNCGRKSTEVITSAQAAQSEADRLAQDPEYQQALLTASAANALANATSGWHVVEQPAQV